MTTKQGIFFLAVMLADGWLAAEIFSKLYTF